MTILLIDGHHLLHRTAFIPELQVLKNSKGEPIGAAFGFIRSLRGAIRTFKPKSCVVVWDSGRSKFRKELYPEYKANRDEKPKPEALLSIDDQKEICQGLLPYLTVKQLVIDGWEGDDLLHLILKTSYDEEDVIIITEDRDLLQLVEEGVSVYRPISDQLINDENFEEMTGIPIELFVLRKAIVGDVSDNIVGVRGVGEKTANKLLKESYLVEDDGKEFWEFGEYEILKDLCASHKTKTARKVAEQWDVVERNLKLVDLKKAPLNSMHRRLAIQAIGKKGRVGTDIELIQELGKLEFNDFLKHFTGWVRPFKRLV